MALASPVLMSQDRISDAGGERIHVWTDRTLYASGEDVLFSAFVDNLKDSSDVGSSRVFYCELITPDGKRIAGGKYLLNHRSGKGSLAIPGETISGVYFLKCYTCFMRNGATGEYKYIMLKIVNPDRPEVLKVNNPADTLEPKKGIAERGNGDMSLTILSGKTIYAPREEVSVKISVNEEQGMFGGLCLSVVPESTFNDHLLPVTNIPDTVNGGAYLPETRGISLSGQLVEKESRKPVGDARVSLSIIGDRDIQVIRTDSSGRFFFALPDYTGNKDIFICANEVLDFPAEILIDNDYCTKPVNLASPAFNLDPEEMKAAYNLVVNSRIHEVFNRKINENSLPPEEKKVAFYGKPSSVLVFDKYIELPTLEEYFTELPVIVKIRKVKGEKQFRFYSENIEMTTYDPVVMVDWVPISNIEKILAMPPREIDKVELVEYPYIKGNITFGGIISFVSKKNDFAGIDLPRSGTFVSYTFLEDCSGGDFSAPAPVNIPDSRNTVFWDPSVQLDPDGTAGISFTVPDTPGNYHLILRGIKNSSPVFFIPLRIK